MDAKELKKMLMDRLPDDASLGDELLDKVAGGLADIARGSAATAGLAGSKGLASGLAGSKGLAKGLADNDARPLADKLALPAKFASLADFKEWAAKLGLADILAEAKDKLF